MNFKIFVILLLDQHLLVLNVKNIQNINNQTGNYLSYITRLLFLKFSSLEYY